jgi:hypothetical protein
MNQRDMKRLIVAVPLRSGGYKVRHDIVGEAIVCEVPTLEIAGCIVKALRERQAIKAAIRLLARHMLKKGKGK